MEAPSNVLETCWTTTLGTPYIQPLVVTAQHEGRLILPYDHLHRANPTLAEALLVEPAKVLEAAKISLKTLGVLGPLRLTGITPLTPIHSLRSLHANRLVAVEGIVKRASEVRHRLQDAKFRCLRCDAVVSEVQDEHLALKEPLQCYEDDGGCGRDSGFRLLTEKCQFVDAQPLEVQEAPDGLRGGDVPQRLSMIAEEELAGLVRPGDRVVVTGILRLHSRRKGNVKSSLFERHLEVVNVEVRQQAYEEVQISKEDEARIHALAANPGVYDDLVASIAPSLYGLEREKLATALVLFGAVRKTNADGTNVRGDIHVGFLGDPGVAKSQLLRYAAKLSLRGIYTDGTGSSGAGLTASAVKDDLDGRWTYEAGAMPLAHGGLCAIDEADKMNEEDQARMLTALEQGLVKLNKAGLDVELPCQTSVLLAGNPKDGRFDLQYASISEQIDLPPPLLSRLDLVFVILDRVEEVRDRATMEHIVFKDRAEPRIPLDLLRRYIAYARQNCHPVVSEEAGRRIVDYYVALRRRKGEGDRVVVPGTPREGEALRRLAQAAARVRLSDRVEVRDVEVGVRLMDECLERMGWDTDKAITGTGSSKRDAIHKVRVIIAELEGGGLFGAAQGDVVREAWERHKVPEVRVVEILERLSRDGELWSQRTGFYKRRETP